MSNYGQNNLGVAYGKGPAGTFVPLSVDQDGNLLVSSEQGANNMPLSATSGNVANANAVATLAAAAGKTTYISGLVLTAAGATAGAAVTATVTGLLGGNLDFTFTFPTGAAVGASPLVVSFPQPLPASAVNTAIVVTLPAAGAGNTNACASAWGYQA